MRRGVTVYHHEDEDGGPAGGIVALTAAEGSTLGAQMTVVLEGGPDGGVSLEDVVDGALQRVEHLASLKGSPKELATAARGLKQALNALEKVYPQEEEPDASGS